MRLCLNAIVKNEADKIERMLKSVAPYISTFRIVDTGSTDGTIDKIMNFFQERGIDGGVKEVPFVNFEQARNAALDYAREHSDTWDFLLLCDADMELVVDDPSFRSQLRDGLSYDAIQRGGSLTYHNRRFINRKAIGKYQGVTHEYLDIEGAGLITGIWFRDYADGTNRANKYSRDIRLLKTALRTEPNNARYWFYLGQSYYEAGKFFNAAAAYKRRIELGGWDEEVWYAKFKLAHANKALGHDDAFVAGLIDAYQYRPSRAEPLYDLANYYRLAGKNFAALMAAEEGMRIPHSRDALFVNDFAYTTGLAEEFSITAFYDLARRARGADVCNRLSLDRNGTDYSRNLARNNLYHYFKPLEAYAPSFFAKRIAFSAPDMYVSMNPSVTRQGDAIKCVVRCVNYTMDEAGRYLIKGTNGEANGTNPIHTRNFLLTLAPDLAPLSAKEILPPEGFPAPAYNLVVGFEDMRLFARDGDLWSISNVREQNPEGWCEQIIARLAPTGDYETLEDYHFIHPIPRQHEKNWMPWVGGSKFVYSLGMFINDTGAVWHGPTPPYAVDGLRGGSQAIDFYGGYLVLVHSAHTRPGDGKRYYQHRFVAMDKQENITAISRPFFFHDKVIEFAAGLAWHPDRKRLIISYGYEDKEAWIATVDHAEIKRFLDYADS